MTKWQPIETAPKDGTAILLCQTEWSKNNPIDLESWKNYYVQVAVWVPEEKDWIVYCSPQYSPPLHFAPTHWMPLPDNPAKKK